MVTRFGASFLVEAITLVCVALRRGSGRLKAVSAWALSSDAVFFHFRPMTFLQAGLGFGMAIALISVAERPCKTYECLSV